MRSLIRKVLELEKTKGQPFNGVKLREARKQLTKKLIKKKKEFLEIDNYVLKVCYTNKDKNRPYTQIYTKESYKNYLDYLIKNI